MAYIMEQDGDGHCPGLIVGNLVAPGADHFNGLTHEMHSPDGVLKPGMVGSRIHEMGEPQLADPAEPLEQRVLHQVKDDFEWNFNKSVYRIIDDFQFVGGGPFPHLVVLCHKIILLLL